MGFSAVAGALLAIFPASASGQAADSGTRLFGVVSATESTTPHPFFQQCLPQAFLGVHLGMPREDLLKALPPLDQKPPEPGRQSVHGWNSLPEEIDGQTRYPYFGSRFVVHCLPDSDGAAKVVHIEMSGAFVQKSVPPGWKAGERKDAKGMISGMIRWFGPARSYRIIGDPFSLGAEFTEILTWKIPGGQVFLRHAAGPAGGRINFQIDIKADVLLDEHFKSDWTRQHGRWALEAQPLDSGFAKRFEEFCDRADLK